MLPSLHVLIITCGVELSARSRVRSEGGGFIYIMSPGVK